MERNGKQRPIGQLVNVSLIDPESGQVTQNVDLCLDGHRITRVGEGAAADGRCHDGSGLYAMPGLIDGHLHALGFLYGDVPGPADLPWVFRQQRRNLRILLRSGITTIRDMCAPLNLVRYASRKAARFELESPRILFAGPMLTCPGGYPHYIDKLPLPLRLVFGAIREEIRDADHARRVVEGIAAAGASCIKVAYQSMAYDDARSPLPALDPWLMRLICEEADRHGLSVAMHNVYLSDQRALASVPFGSLEHLPIDAPMTEDDLEQLVARRIPVSSTLAAYGLVDHVDELLRLVDDDADRFEPKPRRWLRQTYAKMQRGEVAHELFGPQLIATGARWMRHNPGLAHRAGIPIVFGTDTGSGAGLPGCPRFEFEQLSRCGLSNLAILQSATTVAAAAIGRPDLGRLRAGARADIVLLRRNPLDDLSAIDSVVAVIRDGRLVVGQLPETTRRHDGDQRRDASAQQAQWSV